MRGTHRWMLGFVCAGAMGVAMTTTAAHADGVLAFDDAYADLGEIGDPATYYDGVTISGTYSGVWGGVGNGDPGNWDLDGTNGPAFFGANQGINSSPTFTFDKPISSFCIDIGVSNAWDIDFQITAYRAGVQVAQEVINIVDDNNGTGTWKTVSFDVVHDSVVVLMTGSSNGGFHFGMDNVVYSTFPTLSFDDAWAALGDGGDPATFYDGVTISGIYFGVPGGVGNGDPGNWDLHGTRGSAFLGVNTSTGNPTFTFDRPVKRFAIDIGESFGDISDFTVTAFLGGAQVAQQVINVADDNNGSGVWETAAFNQLLDSVQVVLTSTNFGFFDYGMDNIRYASTLPASGPDSFGYTGNMTAYHLRDVSGTGAAGPTGDDQSILVPIGFNFDFYGNTFSDVYISSNGFLSFTDPSPWCCLAQPVPGGGPENAILGAWTDLDPSEGGAIFYETRGVAPNRELVVGFYDVQHNSDFETPPTPVTFEMILHETTNTVELQYCVLIQNEQTYTTEVISIGIQNGTQTDGLQLDFADILGTVDSIRLSECGYAISPPIGPTGPVAGYFGRDTGYNLRDISTSGAAGPIGDDQSTLVALGFDFPYYGATFNQVYVCSNGFLSFTSSSPPFQSSPLPGNGVANMIAGAWTDIDVFNSGGIIRYQTLGVAPNREFVAGYYDVGHRYDVCGPLDYLTPSTFEIILHEGSGDIEFQYKELLHETDECVGVGYQVISIGIQDAALANGIQVDFVDDFATDHSVVHNNRGYVIRDCPWDVNGDNTVDVLDLLQVLGAWGPAPFGTFADLNDDGVVDVLDLLGILGNWGGCP